MTGNTNGALTDSTRSTAADRPCELREAWALRNATAEALLRAEDHIRRQIEGATVADLIGGRP